jgi:hypothetical protein
MFYTKTTKIGMTRKKSIGSFLAMLFCTLVVVSTIGNSFGIRNSFAQQIQTQQPSILTYSSSPNDSWKVLCAQGMCTPSSQPTSMPAPANTQTANPANTQTANPANTQTVDPGRRHHFGNETITVGPDTFANTKNLNLAHAFVSQKVVGPDRFRFITTYWTVPDTSLGVDVGTSANNTFLAASSLPPNQKLEVDTNEGFSTLAVVLQYEGVVDLAGITAALKLPTGFKAQYPLTDDRTNYDIALSDYRGHIYPGQGIVLYFPMYVMPTAKVQLPVLGPLALHFLRTNERSISDSIGNLSPSITTSPSQDNMATKTLSVNNVGNTTFPANTTFTDNFDFQRDYYNQFGRLIPFDFINQVIPVVWKVTGQETLDVVTLPTSGKDHLKNISTNIVTIPNDVTTTVRLAVRNTGDVPIYDLTVNVFPGLQSALGINGLSPSAITSPNIPQTLFSTILPIGIVGPSFFGIGELGPNQNAEFDVSVFPTHYVAGTVELMNVNLVFNNIVGERATQLNQVYFNVTPNP